MDKNSAKVLQLFDAKSSAYTYLVYDQDLLEGALIDPVLECFDRDFKLIKDLGIRLRYVLETHIHEDHVTSAYLFKSKTGAVIGTSASAKVKCADLHLDDGQVLNIGNYFLRAIKTPGHSETCMTFQCENNLFTGDALHIGKCGRTDLAGASAEDLFLSVRDRIFSFPDDYKVYPGHDENGFLSSTIVEEKIHNSYLGMSISREKFFKIMEGLRLEKPDQMNLTLARNLICGQEII